MTCHQSYELLMTFEFKLLNAFDDIFMYELNF